MKPYVAECYDTIAVNVPKKRSKKVKSNILVEACPSCKGANKRCPQSDLNFYDIYYQMDNRIHNFNILEKLDLTEQ